MPRPHPARPVLERPLGWLAGAGLVLLLIAGLGLAVLAERDQRSDAVTGLPPEGVTRSPIPRETPEGTSAVSPAEAAARDELANRRMPLLSEEFMKPRPLSTRDPGPPIVLPAPTRTGPAGVATGFPRTPQGALAQLAAIDQAAMESATLTGAREVIRDWALLGGPTPRTWSGVTAMASLLSGAGLSGAGSPQLSVVVTPAMGLIKGTVGPDFVVPCVDFEFTVTLDHTVRAALADCQRMVWTRDTGDPDGPGGRWMIGPGPEPAEAPSVWPDTDEAFDAGYRDLVHDEPTTDEQDAGGGGDA